jgi:hypothetical protein
MAEATDGIRLNPGSWERRGDNEPKPDNEQGPTYSGRGSWDDE